MRVLVLLVVCLGAAKQTVAANALSAGAQELFTDSFKHAVYDKVDAAYRPALADIAAIDTDAYYCNVAIVEAQSACEEHISTTCSESLEVVETFLDDGVDAVANFLTGETWPAGFEDTLMWMAMYWDEFSEFDPFSDLSGMLRKRRSIGSSRSTKEEMSKLLDMMRSLKNQRPNQERRTQVKVATLSRRELSTEQQTCMQQSTSCDPFLGDTEYLVSEVCASYDFVNRQTALSETVNKIVWVAEGLMDMVVQTETGGTFNYVTMTMSKTYITAEFKSGSERYLSAQTYPLFDMLGTAAACGDEYWDTKYDLYNTV